MSWQRIRKSFIIFFIVLGVLILCLLPHFGFNYFSGNVHTVIPDNIYRSAQLDEKQLTEYNEKFHLKSMINLRGIWENNRWYQVESQFAKDKNINYFSIGLKAYSLPTKQQLQTLVFMLLSAPKPLIFHCEGGADRTGLASAISVILFHPDSTVPDLKRQASWHYNVISPRSVGYQVLKNYFAWLNQNHYMHSRARFLEWVSLPDAMKPYYGWFIA